MFFSNLLEPYKLDIFLLECKKGEKPQVHFRPQLIQFFLKCNILSTYNLHKGYKVDYGICLNSHEYI
jgi:hypothetical protein